MTNKTNINNFGRFGASLAIYADVCGELSYDSYTYGRAMKMTDDQLIDAINDACDNKIRKMVRAAYAVARCTRAINSWRNA